MKEKEEEKVFPKVRLNWFPGHMAKTLRQIEADLKLVDLVIELLDARIPISSQNPETKKLIADKKRIVILNKSDLADEKENIKWVNKFESQNIPAILCNSNTGEGIQKITSRIEKLMEEEKQKAEAKGRIGKIIRVMIIGVPNVGKSSLINRMAQKTSAQVGNKPGVTKQKQWIRLSNNIELLDTPGVLWPKFEDKCALHLAYTGTIKDEIIDKQEVAYRLLTELFQNYKANLVERYKLKEDEMKDITILELMQIIGKKRGALVAGGIIDEEKVANIILDDFRMGKLGRITLERVEV